MIHCNFVLTIFVLIVTQKTFTQDSESDKEARKRYGLNFDDRCKNYKTVFKCMTTCKSIGYEVYRINFRCKCVCFKLKTTTELPFYIWRTNGTTRKLPRTFSPKLYDVVGTLSPKDDFRNETLPVGEETTEADFNDTDGNDTDGNDTDIIDTTPDQSGGGGGGDDGTGGTGGDAGGDTTAAPA